MARTIYDAHQLLDELWQPLPYRDSRRAIAHAVYLSLRSHPEKVFTGGDGSAAWYCARAIDDADSLLRGLQPTEDEQDEGETETRTAIASLLRDIYGNPFCPITINPAWLAWNNSTVPKIAQTIYDERVFDRMPILADALEEAGCTDADILNHCRKPGEHVRGCWVVDLLLDKE